ncbi:MAG: (Fe-S)-binding protein [SAR202 cluster bacterium]|nr:(Fe-S)-binding protein [SAR202 cluster bacterium]
MTGTPGLDFFSGPDSPSETDLYKCVHCGFCLQVCPTYLLTGLEAESPRGRIALMKAVNEERIEATPDVIDHWDLCIQCRACEVACPSGVPYGKLIEATMSQVAPRRKPGMLPKLAGNLLLKQILPHQRRLALVTGGLRMYQRTGAQALVLKTRLLKMISPDQASLADSAPTVPANTFKAEGQVIAAQGPKRARVALLSGCVMPLVHGPQMDAVTRVLARNGCEVVVTREQSCCGAINSHVGDLDLARDLARQNVDAFMSEDFDAVIVASAGCGARMKEYGHLLRHDHEYADRAEALAAKVKDVHEFLAELPLLPPKGRLEARVTYQDSCHLANAQRITDAPRELLRAIPGLELIEMEGAAQCCGAGGTYTVTQREFSLRLLDARMEVIAATGAQIVATANPGCILQLDYGARLQSAGLVVRYVTDLLDEAYRAE